MKNNSKVQNFPWWAIPLFALASFRFDYHFENGSQFTYNGTATALFIIGIISLVMVFGVTKHVQQVLKARKLISKFPRSPLWILLPFSILLPAVGYRAISSDGFTDKFSEKYVHQWDLRWGGTPLHVWLVVGTLIIIFLHTITLTLKEIERTATNSEQGGGNNSVSHL